MCYWKLIHVSVSLLMLFPFMSHLVWDSTHSGQCFVEWQQNSGLQLQDLVVAFRSNRSIWLFNHETNVGHDQSSKYTFDVPRNNFKVINGICKVYVASCSVTTVIAGSFRVSLFIDLGCPSDLVKCSDCFMIIGGQSADLFISDVIYLPACEHQTSRCHFHMCPILFCDGTNREFLCHNGI